MRELVLEDMRGKVPRGRRGDRADRALVLGRLGGRTDAAPTELWADHARAFVRESWWLGTGGAVPDGGWGLAFQAIIAGGILWLAFRLVHHR